MAAWLEALRNIIFGDVTCVIVQLPTYAPTSLHVKNVSRILSPDDSPLGSLLGERDVSSSI